jgi:hypothetical protein
MTDDLVLHSRQANRAVAPRAPQGPSDALIEKAKLLAAAQGVLPDQYKNKPGACMLAIEWAERNNVSILEALGEVSFVHGRPVVSGRLQKRLAARAGYTARKIAGDAQSCTVAVYGPDGQFIGDYTYTIDMAQALGLVKGQVWKADPAQMLYWRALTRALEQYGPGDMATVFHEEQGTDPLPVVQHTEITSGAAEPIEPSTELSDAAMAAAKADQIAEPVIDDDPAPTEQELRDALKDAGLKMADAIRAVQQMHEGEGLATLEKIADHPEAGYDLMDWIKQQT